MELNTCDSCWVDTHLRLLVPEAPADLLLDEPGAALLVVQLLLLLPRLLLLAPDGLRVAVDVLDVPTLGRLVHFTEAWGSRGTGYGLCRMWWAVSEQTSPGCSRFLRASRASSPSLPTHLVKSVSVSHCVEFMCTCSRSLMYSLYTMLLCTRLVPVGQTHTGSVVFKDRRENHHWHKTLWTPCCVTCYVYSL